MAKEVEEVVVEPSNKDLVSTELATKLTAMQSLIVDDTMALGGELVLFAGNVTVLSSRTVRVSFETANYGMGEAIQWMPAPGKVAKALEDMFAPVNVVNTAT